MKKLTKPRNVQLPLCLLLFFLFLLPVAAKSQIWNMPSGIREIAVQGLPDIAIASLDNLGPVIYVNPVVAQQVGPYAMAFFMAHEYGHHYLGHIVASVMNANNPYAQAWLSATSENQADAFAVRYWVNQGNKEVIQAGAQVMWNINNAGDRTHPPSRIRANNIANLYFQLTQTPLFP